MVKRSQTAFLTQKLSMSSTTATETDELIERLDQAGRRLERAETKVDEFGKDRLEELATAHREFTALLDRYEDEVVGDAGDVRTNVEFQSQIAETVNNMPSGMLLRETFIECAEALKKKWFKTADFEHVREQLEPVDDLVARVDEYDAANSEYRNAKKAATRHRRTLDERISEFERLVELGEADLDAPTERLRDPIEAYNAEVSEAFESFLQDAPAREVISFLEATDAYPLVPFELPPADLRTYLRENPVGEKPVHTLLEYAKYSRSKLDHYVEDAGQFDHLLSRQKTYLSRLSPLPLTIDWPPPTAEELRWRCEELTPACNRLSPDVVAALRQVESLPRETDYERLRTSIVAREQLTDEERTRLENGNVEAELKRTREQRARLADSIADHDG